SRHDPRGACPAAPPASRASPRPGGAPSSLLRRRWLTLGRLPELIDVLHRVDHRVLQLAADLLHAPDVRRDDGVLLVVEAKGAARRLEAHLAERVEEPRLVFHV